MPLGGQVLRLQTHLLRLQGRLLPQEHVSGWQEQDLERQDQGAESQEVDVERQDRRSKRQERRTHPHGPTTATPGGREKSEERPTGTGAARCQAVGVAGNPKDSQVAERTTG
ncbi:MAG: hypothetical protein COY42_06500 [Armatimonadetes bacterium CG_4_10_14_0_8_um_filter_66_14]|nr:MAG: hypothetical protein AUJ96_30245 [Armatimonadetes bacterium CG2_30_66_41]PIZ48410.1 MAG: hypothetical protein COY42_06500 [Armatimonadetes bacterium CG_4_10_14_0_8_um_filter_66_14]